MSGVRFIGADFISTLADCQVQFREGGVEIPGLVLKPAQRLMRLFIEIDKPQ